VISPIHHLGLVFVAELKIGTSFILRIENTENTESGNETDINLRPKRSIS